MYHFAKIQQPFPANDGQCWQVPSQKHSLFPQLTYSLLFPQSHLSQPACWCASGCGVGSLLSYMSCFLTTYWWLSSMLRHSPSLAPSYISILLDISLLDVPQYVKHSESSELSPPPTRLFPILVSSAAIHLFVHTMGPQPALSFPNINQLGSLDFNAFMSLDSNHPHGYNSFQAT